MSLFGKGGTTATSIAIAGALLVANTPKSSAAHAALFDFTAATLFDPPNVSDADVGRNPTTSRPTSMPVELEKGWERVLPPTALPEDFPGNDRKMRVVRATTAALQTGKWEDHNGRPSLFIDVSETPQYALRLVGYGKNGQVSYPPSRAQDSDSTLYIVPPDVVKVGVERLSPESRLAARIKAYADGYSKELFVLPPGEKGVALDWQLKTTDGKIIKAQNFAGKIVIIDVWATWCGSCKSARKEIEEIAKAHPKKVVVVSVNYNDDPKKAEAAQKNDPPGYFHVRVPDKSEHSSLWQKSRTGTGEYGISDVVIIDQQGKLVREITGAMPGIFKESVNPLLK